MNLFAKKTTWLTGAALLGAATATCDDGTAALIVKDPAGRWVQAGPSWSVAATQAGREVARIQIPRTALRYKLLVTGGPTLGTAFLVGHRYGG